MEELPVAKSGSLTGTKSKRSGQTRLSSCPSADLCISLTRTEVTSADETEQEPAPLLRSTGESKTVVVLCQPLSEDRP